MKNERRKTLAQQTREWFGYSSNTCEDIGKESAMHFNHWFVSVKRKKEIEFLEKNPNLKTIYEDILKNKQNKEKELTYKCKERNKARWNLTTTVPFNLEYSCNCLRFSDSL